jgi:hypothetical protein
MISDKVFRLLLQRHLVQHFCPAGVKLFYARHEVDAAAGRAACKATLRPNLCTTGFNHRHGFVAGELKNLCRWAGLGASLTEVLCFPGNLDVPADLYIFNGPGGIPLAVDVTVGSPICISMTKLLTKTLKPGVYLAAKKQSKMRKYKEPLPRSTGRFLFFPSSFPLLAERGGKPRTL